MAVRYEKNIHYVLINDFYYLWLNAGHIIWKTIGCTRCFIIIIITTSLSATYELLWNLHYLFLNRRALACKFPPNSSETIAQTLVASGKSHCGWSVSEHETNICSLFTNWEENVTICWSSVSLNNKKFKLCWRIMATNFHFPKEKIYMWLRHLST